MPTHTPYNKFVVTLCCVMLWAMQLNAQDTAMARVQTPKPTTTQTQTAAPIKEYKTEILTSGFIDIVNNGQVNASARFIRLYIGEPSKFAILLLSLVCY